MKLSAYPAPNTDYQILTRNYLAPHPAPDLAPDPAPDPAPKVPKSYIRVERYTKSGHACVLNSLFTWSKWPVHLEQMAYSLGANGLFTWGKWPIYLLQVAEFFQKVAGLIHHYSEFARIIYFLRKHPVHG